LEAQQFHFIPHSGWAALQIVLGYFETIAYFKQGDPSLLKKHGELFKWGVDDVFQNFKDHNPKLRNALWEELRGGLYHSGIAKSKISIEHREPSVSVRYDSAQRRWIIDPHQFVRDLGYSNKIPEQPVL